MVNQVKNYQERLTLRSVSRYKLYLPLLLFDQQFFYRIQLTFFPEDTFYS